MANKKKEVTQPVLPPQIPEPQEKSWSLSIGIYPGILFGIRTYEEPDFKTHVLYLPFVDFALEIDN
jgi:hypothetical protein